MGTGRPRRSNRSSGDLRARSASMTAMSAQRASDANPFPERTVLLPGSPSTYEHRMVLRDLGLRWDPENHRWHGSLAPAAIRELREKHGIVVRCFGSLDPPQGPEPPTPVAPPRPMRSLPSQAKVAPIRDSSRTRAEARVVDREADEDTEEITTPTRRFSLLDITSGLPDDSREAEEREAERRLRDLRGRVKAARAVIARAPGLSDLLASDWGRAAWFYARFGVNEQFMRHGVTGMADEDFAQRLASPMDSMTEARERAEAVWGGQENTEDRPPHLGSTPADPTITLEPIRIPLLAPSSGGPTPIDRMRRAARWP